MVVLQISLCAQEKFLKDLVSNFALTSTYKNYVVSKDTFFVIGGQKL